MSDGVLCDAAESFEDEECSTLVVLKVISLSICVLPWFFLYICEQISS